MRHRPILSRTPEITVLHSAADGAVAFHVEGLLPGLCVLLGDIGGTRGRVWSKFVNTLSLSLRKIRRGYIIDMEHHPEKQPLISSEGWTVLLSRRVGSTGEAFTLMADSLAKIGIDTNIEQDAPADIVEYSEQIEPNGEDS